MTKAKARFFLLALLLPLLLNATHILRDDLLNPKAAKMVEDMSEELSQKVGIDIYVIATNERFEPRFNLVEYSKKYDSNKTKQNVTFIFAPNAKLTQNSEQRGRIAFIPSSDDIAKLYDKSTVMSAAIDIVATKDKNSDEDKYNIAIVQAVSELADEIAKAKGVKLTKTIPNETNKFIGYVKIPVYIGSLIVLWLFMFRPLFMRIRHGKQD
jgi:hypothetical protein